jgi:type I restriction enzyme S subunit
MKQGATLSLPKGWEIKKLGGVLVKTEMVDPTKNPNMEFTYLDVSSVNKETKEIEGATVLLGKDAPSRARKLVRENDVIFATVRPTHSRVALITEEYDGQVCSTGYFVLRGKENIDNKYLFYYLLTDEFNKQMEKLQKGASYPAVTDAEVKSIFLRYPKSLPEQQRIVSILDECFAAIDKAKANAEQNLKNAKELFESYLQGVFENGGEGWEEKTLKEVCGKITDGTHQTPKYFDEGIIFLSSKNVTSGKIDWDNIKYIDEKQHIEMHKRVSPRVGDILLAKNGTTGVAAMVDRDVVFDIYVSLAHIRVLDEVTPEFMLHFINSPVAKKQFNKRLKGSGVPNLHLEEIREVIIPFPRSLKDQQTIVHQLDALRAETQKLEAVYQKKMADLEELKKSILQKAFAGELRSPEGAEYNSEGATPLANKEGYSPSDKTIAV